MNALVNNFLSAGLSSWGQYLSAAVLVAVRLSGLMIFAPVFSSAAIAPRIKAGFVLAMTMLLAPVVGLLFGLCLTMLTESLLFAGSLIGMSFSFSLVNLLDPNTRVETPVLGQMLGWFGVLVIIASGLDRTLLEAVVRSFRAVPVGHAVLAAESAAAVARMAGGIFLAGLQLATPVMAAAMVVEMAVSMVSRLAPMLPVQVVGIPIKTLTSYVVLAASLGVWPGWIESHFNALLNAAGKLLVRA
jgi:flagellar biosynthetic protein FliR